MAGVDPLAWPESDGAGAAMAGADTAGADTAGADTAGADPAGADPAGADPAGADPAEHAVVAGQRTGASRSGGLGQPARLRQIAGYGRTGGSRHAAPRKQRSLLRELPVLVIVAIVIAMLIKSFVVQAFVIPTGSMQNTLALQDKILVNKLVYHFRGIQPGDIVVFDGTGTWDAQAPQAADHANALARAYDDTLRKVFDAVGGLFGTPIGQTDYVKRVIGVPGDHVVCCNASGLITVNGVPLHEQSYLYPGDHPASAPPGSPGNFSIRVPAGYLWVLGDHRSVSDDSRGHQSFPGNGMIPENKVIGRAFVIAWPPSQWRILSIPATFAQPGVTRAAAGRASGAHGTIAAAGSGIAIRPAAPYVQTTASFAGAFPVWWLFRRFKDRSGHRRRWRG